MPSKKEEKKEGFRVTKDKFNKNYKRVMEEIHSWPDWKQKALGINNQETC